MSDPGEADEPWISYFFRLKPRMWRCFPHQGGPSDLGCEAANHAELDSDQVILIRSYCQYIFRGGKSFSGEVFTTCRAQQRDCSDWREIYINIFCIYMVMCSPKTNLICIELHYGTS